MTLPLWVIGLAIAVGASFSFWFLVAAVIPKYRANVYELPDVWARPDPSECCSNSVSEQQVFRSAKAVNDRLERRVLRPSFQKGNPR